MWNKAKIVCLAGLALVSCTPSTDIQTMGDDVSSVSDVKPSTAPHSNAIETTETPIGMVPIKTSEKTAPMQARLAAYLIDNSGNIKFAVDTIPIAESVMRQLPGLPAMITTTNPQSGLHLVIDNIQPLPNLAILAVTNLECNEGRLFRGYAAANPSLFTSTSTEGGYAIEAAIPYGLIICDQGDGFEVLALPITHELFKNDSVKNNVLKTLPKDHPLFNSK